MYLRITISERGFVDGCGVEEIRLVSMTIEGNLIRKLNQLIDAEITSDIRYLH